MKDADTQTDLRITAPELNNFTPTFVSQQTPATVPPPTNQPFSEQPSRGQSSNSPGFSFAPPPGDVNIADLFSTEPAEPLPDFFSNTVSQPPPALDQISFPPPQNDFQIPFDPLDITSSTTLPK
eukprot:TRINITY_DN1215_c0_g2_i3.p1 TRINITY_DN1215_c0_g2~~TRINITY_DN1215_c0_g2_i3.p1  ORF type:complete len:124 (-),score=25.41 TRINITY_DN1215_c0_g2_i3:1040-1411(-)